MAAMSLWKIEHVLKLERVGRSEFEHYTRNRDLFIDFIDCSEHEIGKERNQELIKVLSDASYITNECTSLVNLHLMYEQQRQNFTEHQEIYVIKRMLMAANHIDNGECFSPLDPRNRNVQKKGDSRIIVNGYSNDDINMSGSMRTKKYWPMIFRTDKHLKMVKTCVQTHVEGFCKGVHGLVWSLQNRLSVKALINIRDPLTNLLPTIPILSIEDWHKVVTQMYMNPPPSPIEAQNMLKIRNTFNYPTGNNTPRLLVPTGRIQGNVRAGNAPMVKRSNLSTAAKNQTIKYSKPAPSAAKNQNAVSIAVKAKHPFSTASKQQSAVKSNPSSSTALQKENSIAVKSNSPSESSSSTNNSKPAPSAAKSQNAVKAKHPFSTASKQQSAVKSNPSSSTALQKENSIAVKSNSPSGSSSLINSKEVSEVAQVYDRWTMKNVVKEALAHIYLLEKLSFDQVMKNVPVKIAGLLKYRPEVSKDIDQFVRVFPKIVPAYAPFIYRNVNNNIGLCPLSRLCAIPLSDAIGEKFLLGDKYPCNCRQFLGPCELINHCETVHSKIHDGAFLEAMKAILLGSGITLPEVRRTVDKSPMEIQRFEETKRPEAAVASSPKNSNGDNNDESGGKSFSNESINQSNKKDDPDQSNGGGDSNSERESSDRSGNNNNDDNDDDENNRDSSNGPDADATESEPTESDTNKIDDCKDKLLQNPIDISKWGTTEEREEPEKILCLPMIRGQICGRLYPNLFNAMIVDSDDENVDTKWDIGLLDSFVATFLDIVEVPANVYVHPKTIAFSMDPDTRLVERFDEEVVERLKRQMNSEQQMISLILFSSQSKNVTPDEAPDHVGLLVVNNNPKSKKGRIDLNQKDAKYLNSITAHDPYGSFDEKKLLLILRQFALDLGSVSVVGPKDKVLVEGDYRTQKDTSTLVSKIQIRSLRGDKTVEACAAMSMEKLITIMEKLDIANMIASLDMNTKYGVKAKMAVVIAQYLLQYLESNKTECDGDLPGFYQSFVIREGKLEQSPRGLSSKDISILFLKSLVKSPEQRIEEIADYSCICSRIVNCREPRIICTNCFGEYHPACFEYYAELVGETGKLFCHQCTKQMSVRCPPVFQAPNSLHKESGKLMNVLLEGTIVFDNIPTSNIERKPFFERIRKITNNYDCSSVVANDDDFRSFCQLIAVNESLNKRDALTEHKAIMSKTVVEIAETLGGTLEKYQSEFVNFIGPKQDDEEIDFNTLVEEFAKKLKCCSSDDFSDRMETEIENRILRMSTVASISLVGFYFTEESQASDNVHEVVKYCREKFDHGASIGTLTHLLDSFITANQHQGYNALYLNELTNGSAEQRARFLKLLVDCVLGLPTHLSEKFFIPKLEEQIKKQQERQSHKRKKEAPSSCRDIKQWNALGLIYVAAHPNVKVLRTETVMPFFSAGDPDTLIQQSITELYEKTSPWMKTMGRASFVESATSALKQSIHANDIPHIVQAVEFIWQNAGSQSNSDAVVTSSSGSPVKKRLKLSDQDEESLSESMDVQFDAGKKGESVVESVGQANANNQDVDAGKEGEPKISDGPNSEELMEIEHSSEHDSVHLGQVIANNQDVDAGKEEEPKSSDNLNNDELEKESEPKISDGPNGGELMEIEHSSENNDELEKESVGQVNANNQDVDAGKNDEIAHAGKKAESTVETSESPNNDEMEIVSDGQVNANKQGVDAGKEGEPKTSDGANSGELMEIEHSSEHDSVHLYYRYDEEWTLSANKPEKVIGKGDTITFLDVALTNDPLKRVFNVRATVGDFIRGRKESLPFELRIPSDAGDVSKSMHCTFFQIIEKDATLGYGRVSIDGMAEGESVSLDQLGVRVPTGTTYYFEWIAISCGLEIEHSHTDDELTLRELQSRYSTSDPSSYYQNFLVQHSEELDRRFRQERNTNQKFCYPVGLYVNLRDRSIVSRGKHNQLPILWHTIVLPQGSSRQMIADDCDLILQTTVRGPLGSCSSSMSDESKLAKLYISELESFHERREPQNVARSESNNDEVMINQVNGDDVAAVGDEEDARGLAADVDSGWSCPCCRTRGMLDENKSLGVVHEKPHTTFEPRLLRIIHKSMTDEFDSMREHSPYSWEVTKYTDIFESKILDHRILMAGAPIIVLAMTVFSDLDTRAALDRHLNRPFDDEFYSSIDDYVISPFKLLRDFCCGTNTPSFINVPGWWNMPSNSYQDHHYVFGQMRRKCIYKSCKVENCTLLQFRPLFSLKYDVTPEGMSFVNKLQAPSGEVHCDGSVLSQGQEFVVIRKEGSVKFPAIYKECHKLLNKIVEMIQKSQADYGDRCYDFEPMKEFRKGVEKLFMDHILSQTILTENNQKDAAENAFKAPVMRFAWAMQQRILSLRKIAKVDEPKCFGGCDYTVTKDNIECDWQTHMQGICKKMSKLKKGDPKINEWKATLKAEEEKKRKEEERGNYGYKICKTCYPGRKCGWPTDD